MIKSTILFLGVFVLMIASGSVAFGQAPTVDELFGSVEEVMSEPAAIPEKDNAQIICMEIKERHEKSLMQFKIIESVILLIAAIICQRTALHYMQKRGNYSIRHVVSITGMLAIVFGTLVLIMIADTDQQMTAAVGILGAIAGYIFGKSRMEDEIRNDLKRGTLAVTAKPDEKNVNVTAGAEEAT